METHTECEKHQTLELRDATTMSKHFHPDPTWDLDVSVQAQIKTMVVFCFMSRLTSLLLFVGCCLSTHWPIYISKNEKYQNIKTPNEQYLKKQYNEEPGKKNYSKTFG